MATQLQDLNRRPIPLQKSKIKEILPEYFVAEFPTFITFLEKYYEFLDSDGTHSFDTQIQQLFSTRDIDQTPQNLLDTLGKEFSQGVSTVGTFSDPRYSLRRFGDLYRAKGTPVAADQFFRSFFGVEPTIEYPKENLFTVGYARNQIFSILYKVPLSLSSWSKLYKEFVHPAGYFFSVDVQIEADADLALRSMPAVLEDSASGLTSLVQEGVTAFSPSFEQFTTLQTDELTGVVFRNNPEETVETYQDLAIDSLDAIYDNIRNILTPNSFKFDDSTDSTAPDFSLTFETFDQEMFDSYGKAF